LLVPSTNFYSKSKSIRINYHEVMIFKKKKYWPMWHAAPQTPTVNRAATQEQKLKTCVQEKHIKHSMDTSVPRLGIMHDWIEEIT
jgi:hypothetical protein